MLIAFKKQDEEAFEEAQKRKAWGHIEMSLTRLARIMTLSGDPKANTSSVKKTRPAPSPVSGAGMVVSSGGDDDAGRGALFAKSAAPEKQAGAGAAPDATVEATGDADDLEATGGEAVSETAAPAASEAAAGSDEPAGGEAAGDDDAEAEATPEPEPTLEYDEDDVDDDDLAGLA